MGLSTVTAVAADRVKVTTGDDLFCQTCTGYIGRMGHGPKGCLGTPEAFVAFSNPPSTLEHDHR